MFKSVKILSKFEKKYKEIYKKGKNLKVLNISLPSNGMTQLCFTDVDDETMYGMTSYLREIIYLYSFRIEYEDVMGNKNEIYSEPYSMPVLNSVLNYFSSRGEIEQVLRSLQFEVKEYEGQVKAYVSVTKEKIKEFKKTRDLYKEKKRNLIVERKISMNEEVNNYIVKTLNSFFEKRNIKITLNQNAFIENKARYELLTGYNYNMKDLYSTQEIIQSIEKNEYSQSQLLLLFKMMSIDVMENKEITIYISNYSQMNKMEGLVIEVYCKID